MKDLGVYGDTNLTNILMNEFILGSNKNLTLSENELVNEVKNKVANASMEDFATYASQSCSNLIISIKFQGQILYWNDFNGKVGPMGVKTDYGICCFVSPYLSMNPINWTLGKARTTKITLDGILRGKITIMLEIKKFSKPFY